MIHEFHPPELIALQEEILKHPALMEILGNQTSNEPYIHIVEIATYCGVIVDGDYTKDDIIGLCKVLVGKLQQKRSVLILPNAPGSIALQ